VEFRPKIIAIGRIKDVFDFRHKFERREENGFQLKEQNWGYLN